MTDPTILFNTFLFPCFTAATSDGSDLIASSQRAIKGSTTSDVVGVEPSGKADDMEGENARSSRS